MSGTKPREVMRATLALTLLLAFMLALAWLLESSVPDANEQLVVFMLGQLSILVGQGVNYYLGTSKSSADKNELLEAPRQVEVVNPKTRPVPVDDPE